MKTQVYVIIQCSPYYDSGQAVIAYADKDYVVLYECDHVMEDGSCDPKRVSVDVLSRSNRRLSSEAKTRLSTVAHSLCFSPDDFRTIDHDGRMN